jgi:hypothetical protein
MPRPVAETIAIVAVAGGLVGLALFAVSKTDAVKLAGLEPETARRVQELQRRMAARGIKTKITVGRRSPEQQLKEVEQGDSAVTIGWHMSGRAADLLVWDDKLGAWDEAGRREDLYRLMHQEWFNLGGHGLAYSPYPTGPVHRITTKKGKVWDAGHVEYHGPFTTAAAAWTAEQGKATA